MLTKWDYRFVEMAQLVASWSKDPSTKVGAVIADRDNRVISVGYNGPPKNVKDDPFQSENKIRRSVSIHAEQNAVIFARQRLFGCTMYSFPILACPLCASIIVNSGIRRVVSTVTPEHKRDRWDPKHELAHKVFQAAGVEVIQVQWAHKEDNSNGLAFGIE